MCSKGLLSVCVRADIHCFFRHSSSSFSNHCVLKMLIPGSQTSDSSPSLLLQSIAKYHCPPTLKAGHNRWSKIGRKKAVVDLKRSNIIQKFRNQIATAIRLGKSADPDSNVGLASAIARAKRAGLSKASVDGAVVHATAKQEGGELVVYEGRADDGYMLIIEVLTANKNRTRPILRKWLKDNGCAMGESGSSLFNFNHKGTVRIPCNELQAARTDPLDLAIEVGAEEVIADTAEAEHEPEEEQEAPAAATSDSEQADAMAEVDEKCFQFLCDPCDLKSVSDSIKARSFTVSSASVEYIPKTYVELNQRKYEKALRIIGQLSEQDDVVEVYDNFVLKKEE